MTARERLVFDAAEHLTTPQDRLTEMVLAATLAHVTAPDCAYYNARLSELGLALPGKIAALANIVPGSSAVAGLPDTTLPPENSPAWVAIRDRLHDAADTAHHPLMDYLLTTRAAAPASDDATPLGCVDTIPANPAVVATYFGAVPLPDWRTGLRPASPAILHVLVARDPALGMLLGPGMVFTGSHASKTGDMLPAGLVLSGPRTVLPPGKHWLDLDLHAEDCDALHLDIASNRGLRRLLELNLRGPTRLQCGFCTDTQDIDLEIRLVNPAATPIRARINRLAITQ